MNKLSQKFMAGILVILSVSTCASALLNAGFVDKYYLHQKKRVSLRFAAGSWKQWMTAYPMKRRSREIEAENKVIAVSADSRSSDNDMINYEIRDAFQVKGVGFQKFWLWEEDYKEVMRGKNRIRLYSQEKLNYSLLVEYAAGDSRLFSVAMILPDIKDAVRIMNACTVSISFLTILLSLLFIFILVRRVTAPLKQFDAFAASMGRNEFHPLEIHTNDELERAAANLNAMGNQITAYQKSLQNKKEQMEQLLDNVAHDLKTPVSLIRLYADGIKDGLDDGTFLDTIMQQSSQMDRMINRLLFLTRIEKKSHPLNHMISVTCCRISWNPARRFLKEQNLEFVPDIQAQTVVTTNGEWMESVFSNLITNAVKYASGHKIWITPAEKRRTGGFHHKK
ncbi:HAMP domain-containing histidine kinase [Blautia sp. RD014234]|nr:HAMP domain-containing histidine kinase [Blautia parvula]